MSNKDSWNSMQLVNAYVNDKALQKPEETIMSLIRDYLKDWRMLDLGIGLGRTTRHFAPLVKEYIGVDYSFNMIKTYQKLFPAPGPNAQVRLGDARMMSDFQPNYFDFIFFSYNGIDYVSHEDRMHIFEEVKRVSKKGSLFVFSTHNLQYVNSLYSINPGNSIKHFLYQCYRFFRLFYENGLPKKYKNIDYSIINDGAHHFKIKTYYIKPVAQVEQLERAGFKNVRLFSLKTGAEISRVGLNGAVKDSWIYYWCEV